jgi:hypothetical protein
MSQNNKPNFAAWPFQSLVDFCNDAFDDMVQKQVQIEELKEDKAALLATIRKYWIETN